MHAAEEGLADLERAHFHNDRGRRPASGLHFSFDDGGAGRHFRARFQLEDFGLQIHHFKQVLDPEAFGRGDRANNGRTAPVLRSKAELLQLLLHAIDIGGG